MNAGKITVTLQTNDRNDARRCVLPAVPARGDMFILDEITYRVSQICYAPLMNVDTHWYTKITLILENT